MASSKLPKLLLAAGLAALAVKAGMDSLAIPLAERQPSLALALDADQPDALGAEAINAFAGQGGADVATDRAIAALMANPMEAKAIAQLGIVRQLESEDDEARALLEHSLRLSRRATSAHLWWIEYWAARGDLDRALYHYNSTLRTSRAAPSTLFPTLVNAVRNPLVARGVADIFTEAAPWHGLFLQQLAQSGQPRAIETLFAALSAEEYEVAPAILNDALARLIDLGSAREAADLYASTTGREGADAVRDLPDGPAVASATLFDWRIVDGAPAYFEDGALVVEPSGSERSALATQLLALGQGPVSLVFDIADDGGNATGFDPRLACRGGIIPVTQDIARSNGSVVLSASVPAQCALQELTLFSAGAAEELRIGSVRLAGAVR